MLHRCIAAVIISIGIGAGDGHAGQRPAASLEVLLTVAPDLSDTSRAALVAAATAIWREHGVHLEWLPGTVSRPVSPRRLRVLVVARDGIVADEGEPFTVGRLVRAGSGHVVAFASIERAVRVVESARPPGLAGLAALNDRILGLVLGRAVAHEIGHFLLETHTHASQGLMRAQFDVHELVDHRRGAFALDRAAADWLRARLRQELDQTPGHDAGTFAYAR